MTLCGSLMLTGSNTGTQNVSDKPVNIKHQVLKTAIMNRITVFLFYFSIYPLRRKLLFLAPCHTTIEKKRKKESR